MTATRRRFLTITAGFAALGLARAGHAGTAAPEMYLWRGQALGAEAVIRLPDGQGAAGAAEAAAAEIARLEAIFSLHRPDSALSVLNRDGRLAAPPPELLECLGIAGAVHRSTGGLFDPTVQSLWTLYAVAGGAPDPAQIAAALALTGWDRVSFDAGEARLAPGGALTLNGIAQGYIADRVTLLLTRAGYSDILVNTGEYRAAGGMPGGGDWPVQLAGSGRELPLRDGAVATSAPLGTTFDETGRESHILDPRTGRPASLRWRSVSVSAPQAALADALSTAACLMPDEAAIRASLGRHPGAALADLV